MSHKSIITFGFILIFTLVFVSCEKEEFGENETIISRHGDTESHNNGQNCMNCHTSGGTGEGWFTVAGSVYEPINSSPYPNAKIELYTEPNGSGTFIKMIEVDGKGNFYTTEYIDFANGLYIILSDANGNAINMVSAVSTGQCNSCHGETTDKIMIK